MLVASGDLLWLWSTFYKLSRTRLSRLECADLAPILTRTLYKANRIFETINTRCVVAYVRILYTHMYSLVIVYVCIISIKIVFWILLLWFLLFYLCRYNNENPYCVCAQTGKFHPVSLPNWGSWNSEVYHFQYDTHRSPILEPECFVAREDRISHFKNQDLSLDRGRNESLK